MLFDLSVPLTQHTSPKLVLNYVEQQRQHGLCLASEELLLMTLQ